MDLNAMAGKQGKTAEKTNILDTAKAKLKSAGSKVLGGAKKAIEKVTPAVVAQTKTTTKQAMDASKDASSKKPGLDDTQALGATKDELEYMHSNNLISEDAYKKRLEELAAESAVETGKKGFSQERLDAAQSDIEKANEGEAKADEVISENEKKEAAQELDKKPDEEVKEDLEEVAEQIPSDRQKRYTDATKSIWQAYVDGDISKDTRNYLIVDTLATFAKNLGRNISNVGAQFTGGAVDNSSDSSMWETRNKEMAQNAIQADVQEMPDSPAARQKEMEELDITSKQIQNEAGNIKNAYNKIVNEMAPETLQAQQQMLLTQLGLANLNLDITKDKNLFAQTLMDFYKENPSGTKNIIAGAMANMLFEKGLSGTAQSAFNLVNPLQ